MLYEADTKTISQVVAPGVPITEAELRQLASYIGKSFEHGAVEAVAVVFIGGKEEAEEALPQIKRFGLQCRALVAGVEQILYQGTRVQSTSAAPEGTLLPILREASWPHIDTVVHRRLVPGPVDVGPWVTFGRDSGAVVARFGPKDLGGRTIAEVETDAIANLVAKESFTPKELKPRCIALSGEYACEAILVPAVMKQCARVLGSELLCVAIPKESRFIAVPAEDMQLVGELVGWTREMFDGAEGRRISPLPFIVNESAVGIVSLQTDEKAKGAAGKKAWYKFW